MQVNELQKYDSNALSGYGSALLFRNPDATENPNGKYSILIPLETVPSVFGSTDSFDFDLLTSPTKGKVQGKESLDDVDVEFLWTRDNVARLEKYQGQILDFLVVYQDYTARAFSGSIKVRPNEVSADIAKGTFTITPMSATTSTLLDASDLIMDTIAFVGATPAEVVINGASGTAKLKIALNDASGSIACESTNSKITASAGSGTNGSFDVTFNATNATNGDRAIVTMKATATGKASWERSIIVKVVVA